MFSFITGTFVGPDGKKLLLFLRSIDALLSHFICSFIFLYLQSTYNSLYACFGGSMCANGTRYVVIKFLFFTLNDELTVMRMIILFLLFCKVTFVLKKLPGMLILFSPFGSTGLFTLFLDQHHPVFMLLLSIS